MQLRWHVLLQADVVRKLKNEDAPKLDIQAAVAELKARKKTVEKREAGLTPKEEKFDRNGLEDLLKRRYFYSQSFSIYGGNVFFFLLVCGCIMLHVGVAGLYDYGPMGCAMKSNLVSLWRSHFVLEEGILEIDCSILTPEYVLK